MSRFVAYLKWCMTLPILTCKNLVVRTRDLYSFSITPCNRNLKIIFMESVWDSLLYSPCIIFAVCPPLYLGSKMRWWGISGTALPRWLQRSLWCKPHLYGTRWALVSDTLTMGNSLLWQERNKSFRTIIFLANHPSFPNLFLWSLPHLVHILH